MKCPSLVGWHLTLSTVTIYNVAELAGLAFFETFNSENITSEFKKTGILPCNTEIFTEDMFVTTLVTDVSCLSATSDADNSVPALFKTTEESGTSVLNVSDKLFTETRPFPKVVATNKRCKTCQQN